MTTNLKYIAIKKTRKQHTCFSCYRKFPAGSSMFYFAGIYEDDWSDGYCCNTCDQIHNISQEREIESGFVSEWLEPNQTPEQLLETLQANKNNLRPL